jgi:hypothetical protein
MNGKGPRADLVAEQKAAGDQMRDAPDEFFLATPARKTDQPFGGQDPRLLDVRIRHEADLMRYPNVVGIADGVRMRGGKPTGQSAIVVYVERKVPREELAEGDLLPAEIEGIPVDVVESGRIVPMGILTSS